ncbi:MAG: hypothetical protein ACYCX4_08075 [Bacillota bacterium]
MPIVLIKITMDKDSLLRLILKCSTGALKMKAVRPVDFIPEMVQNG